jgi:DNA-binding CsgD family transcriptional regulator
MRAISTRYRSRPGRRGGWSHSEAHNRRAKLSVALTALDQLCAGVIVTDSGGLVIEVNRAAEAILRIEDGLLIRDGRFHARRAFETAKLARLIAGATEGIAPAPGRMLIGRYDGLPPYVLTVTSLPAEVASRRFAMIIVVDPARHCPAERDLAEFFGLSPTEARVAAALMTGKSLSDIAAISGVQITTVRTQLRSILRKVGVKRQFDLVRMLSATGIGSSLPGWWLVCASAIAQMPLSLAA